MTATSTYMLIASVFPFMSTLNASANTDLANLGTTFTQITNWLRDIVSTITGSPVLLIGLGIFVVGAVIGLAYRLIRG